MYPTRPRVAPALLALVAACLGPAAAAKAQGFGPDPFRPYNSQYDAYVFGVPPGALDGVGNPSLNRQGVRNANQFREAMEGLDNSNRYDRSFRRYDREYNREYRPNAKADARFDSRREEVSDLYFQYLREKDPRKRAALFKQYNQAQVDVSRGLATDPNARGGARRGRGAAVPTPDDPIGTQGPKADTVPPPSAAYPASGGASRGTRRATRATDVPPPPSGDDASPSAVLDRASRSGRSAPPPPPDDDRP